MSVSQERERLVEVSRDGSMEVALELWAEHGVFCLVSLNAFPALSGRLERVQKIF